MILDLRNSEGSRAMAVWQRIVDRIGRGSLGLSA